MAKLNLEYNPNKLDKIKEELKKNEEGRWDNISECEKEIDSCRGWINTTMGIIAKNYILKLFPELSELYERPHVWRNELIDAIINAEPRIDSRSIYIALETLVEQGKLEANHITDYSKENVVYKLPEEKKE